LECSHLPGIIFNTEKAKIALNDYEKIKKKYPTLSTYYPHFIIYFSILVKQNSYYYNKVITCQYDYVENQHECVDSYTYWQLIPRWKLINEVISYLEDLRSINKLSNESILLEEMKKEQIQNSKRLILNAIKSENVDIYNTFIEEKSQHSVLKKIKKILKK
jgi:hypothetical protein